MDALVLPLIALAAAVVNGALGYGFSSITVPIALLFVSNRVLNPALVPVEIALNAYVLWVNREAVPRIHRRVRPVLIGLVPGIVLGTVLISRVDPGPLKLATYLTLLPLILLQAAGCRRPIGSERAASVAFGGGVGLLYALTTISGPPLALALNNQGLAAREFRAALGLIRLCESTLTAVAYLSVGLYSRASVALIPAILPGVAIGVPIGAFLIRHVRAETFRRICMSFDAWIVAFGLSTVLKQLALIEGNGAYTVLVVVALIDAWLLYRFFAGPRAAEIRAAPEVAS